LEEERLSLNKMMILIIFFGMIVSAVKYHEVRVKLHFDPLATFSEDLLQRKDEFNDLNEVVASDKLKFSKSEESQGNPIEIKDCEVCLPSIEKLDDRYIICFLFALICGLFVMKRIVDGVKASFLANSVEIKKQMKEDKKKIQELESSKVASDSHISGLDMQIKDDKVISTDNGYRIFELESQAKKDEEHLNELVKTNTTLKNRIEELENQIKVDKFRSDSELSKSKDTLGSRILELESQAVTLVSQVVEVKGRLQRNKLQLDDVTKSKSELSNQIIVLENLAKQHREQLKVDKETAAVLSKQVADLKLQSKIDHVQLDELTKSKIDLNSRKETLMSQMEEDKVQCSG
jgi:hypothetical protein